MERGRNKWKNTKHTHHYLCNNNNTSLLFVQQQQQQQQQQRTTTTNRAIQRIITTLNNGIGDSMLWCVRRGLHQVGSLDFDWYFFVAIEHRTNHDPTIFHSISAQRFARDVGIGKLIEKWIQPVVASPSKTQKETTLLVVIMQEILFDTVPKNRLARP